MKDNIKIIEKLTISEKINYLVILAIIFITGLGIIGYFSRYADKLPAILIISILILLKTIILATLGIIVIYAIKKPLESLLFKIQQISIGNLEVFQEKISDRDILGDLFIAINVMISNLQTLIQKEQFTKKREELLRQVISASINSLNKEEIIRTIVTRTGELFKADRCFFAPYDYEKQESLPIPDYAVYLSSLNIKSVSGLKFEEKHIAPFKSIAFKQKQIVIVNNVDELTVPDEAKELLRQYDVKSYIAAPLFINNIPLGVVSVQFTKSYKTFPEEEIDLITAISEQTSIALRQAELYYKTKRLADRESILRSIITKVRTTLDIDETLQIISREIAKVFNIERVILAEFPNKNDLCKWNVRVDYINSKNMISFEEANIEKVAGKELGEYLINKNNALILENDVELDIPYHLKESSKILGIKSALVIPIKRCEDFWGTLSINMSSKREWTEDEISLLNAISEDIYLAIKHAEIFSTAKKLSERESLIRKIVSTIRESLDIDETIRIICDELARALNVQRATIAEFSEKGNYKYWIIRREYKVRDDIKGLNDIDYTEDTKEFWGKSTLDSGKSFILDNIAESDSPDYFKRDYATLGVKSIIGVPIRRGDDKWGVIGLSEYDKYRHWTEDEINLVETIADQIYLAIKHSEVYSVSKKQAERAEAIRKIIEAVGANLDLDIVLDIICRQILELLKVDRVAIESYVDKVNFTKWSTASEIKASPDVIGVKDINYPTESKMYFGKTVLREGKEIIVNDVDKSEHPEYFINTYKMMNNKSFLGIPIQREEDKHGILILCKTSRHNWTSDELELLRTIADQTYIAIRQGELYSSTKNLAEKENLLRRINNTILTSKNLEEALDHIAKEISSIINVDRIGLALYDPELKSFSGFLGEYRKNENIPAIKNVTISSTEFNSFLYSNLFEKKDYIIIENLEKLQASEEIINTLRNLEIYSAIMAPIFYQNSLIGFVSLTNTQKSEIIKNENLNILNPILQQIAIGINMFKITDRLNKSLESEKAVRDIFIEARKHNDHNQLFDFLLTRLTELFNLDRAIHLHINEKGDIFVNNEHLTNKKLKSLGNQQLLISENTIELIPKSFGNVIIINDVELEITNAELKKYLKMNDIKALLVYPIARKSEESNRIGSTNMICSSLPRIWTSAEIDTFKLVIDTISLVYFELIQRKETENIRNTFLATLTHDLRSPIIAEQTALNAILAGKLGYSLNEYSEYLEDIFKTNEELLRIVNNILSVYHFESGQLELKLELTSIEQIIFDSIRSMKALAKEQQSEITTSIEPNLPGIYIDKDEINRVITNLLSNAIKHTRKGTNINISAKKEDDTLKIAIKDNGPGIPEEEKSKIFERYPTAKRKIGTGLGLYLSKQLIEAHKGKIWFESEANKGTTFYFTLPYRIDNYQ